MRKNAVNFKFMKNNGNFCHCLVLGPFMLWNLGKDCALFKVAELIYLAQSVFICSQPQDTNSGKQP